MRFSAHKKELADKIHHLHSIVPTKNPIQILTNFLLEGNATGERLRITSTDLEITVVIEIEMIVSDPGKIAVDARNFSDIVHSMPDDIIHFVQKENVLTITCRNSRFELYCAEADQFPLVPDINMEQAREMNALTFAKMVENTHFAVANDSSRPIFTGLYWRQEPDHQLMAATDGRKIAEFDIRHETGVDTPAEYIIPLKGSMFLKKIIDHEISDTMKVLFEPNRIMFQYDNFLILTSLLVGRFPDIGKAIPQDNPNELIVDKSLLRDALNRVSLLASDDTFRVRMDIDEGNLILTCTDRARGEGVEEIADFSYTGKKLTIAFNFRYMNMILSVIESDKVRITMSNSQGAVMLYNVELDREYSARFLLMPLRVV